jgi:general secretion pathway protein M
MKAFTTWWQSLQPREQQLVKIASFFIGLGLFYVAIWQPIHQAKANSELKAKAAAEQLSWLQSRLPLLTQSATVSSSGSINDIVAQTAPQFQIKVSRMQPQNDQLQLSLEDVAFEQLLRWLTELQSKHGVQLLQLDIAASEVPGTVRVRRLVLE